MHDQKEQRIQVRRIEAILHNKIQQDHLDNRPFRPLYMEKILSDEAISTSLKSVPHIKL